MVWYNKDNLELLYAPQKKHPIKKAIKSVRVFAVSFAKRHDTMRKSARRVLGNERQSTYNKYAQSIQTDPRVILFSTFDGRSYGDSPKAIYEEMLKDPRFRDYKFIWSFRNPKLYTYLLDNPNTYIVPCPSADLEKTHAAAKYWIYNYRVHDHIYPKKDQVYIQLWHGTPLKRLGYDIDVSDNAMNSRDEIREKYRIDAQKFKYILSPSAFASEKFISAWNLKAVGRENTVLELGYPRNDFLYNYTFQDVQAIKKKLGIEGCTKKIILYAPTWRDNQHDAQIGYTYKTEVDFDKLQQVLGQEYIILFRAHYLVANSFDFNKYQGFVYDVSGVCDINHLYIISDILITDYSSVFFDYANLKRPIIFYMYDKESYANDLRGFYISLDELPGPISETEEELIKAVQRCEADRSLYAKRYDAFSRKYNYLDDGNASRRVIETIIEEI